MRIKSLELIGFKSFYNKTKVDLSKGINAIVGPNGCGKSNIIDAVRWALGEQNARTLRADNMDELISDGTDVLKPYGMAEVSMTVNNLPNLGFEDVNVKRRLYRSGESEYYINGIKSRLKDITELFLDTGAGARSYSIIGQGKVEEFITAKPEDKRRLIEEVAGIVKYKTRRKETQSRIESTHENLSRVSDMRLDLLKQMKSLSKQAEEAEKYKRLNEQLATLEINILNAKSSEMETEKNALLQKRSGLDEKIRKLSEQKENKEKVLSEVEVKNSEIDNSIDEIENTIHLVRSQTSEKRVFIEYVNKQEASVDEFINRLKKEITSLQNEINQINKSIDKKKLTLNQYESDKQKFDLQLNLKTKELDDLKVESVNNKTELEQSKKVLFEIIDKYSSVKGTAAVTSKELEELKIRKERIEKYREDREEANYQSSIKLNNMKNDLDGLKQSKIGLEKDKFELMQIHASKKSSHQEITESVNDLRERIYEASSKADVLQNIQSSYDWLPEVTRNFILNKSFGGVIGIISDFVTTSKQYEKALEAALGERSNWVVVKSSNEAIAAIDKLRNSCKGRSTFIPLQSEQSEKGLDEFINEHTKITDLITVNGIDTEPIKSMLKNIFVVPTIEDAINARSLSNFPALYVTLEGDLIDTSGAITGGFATGGVFERRREIEELKKNLTQLKDELGSKSSEENYLLDEIHSVENNMSDLDSLLKHNEIKIVELEKDVSNMELVIRENEKNILKATSEIKELNELIQDKENKVLQYDSTLQMLEKDKEKFDLRFNKFEEVVKNYEHRERLIEQDITGLKVRSASVGETQKSTNREISNLIERIEKLNLKINEGKGEIELKNKEKVNLVNRGRVTEEEVVELEENLKTAEKKLLDVNEQKQRSRENLNKNKQDLIDIEKESVELKELKSSYEIKLNSINIELNYIREETHKISDQRGLPNDIDIIHKPGEKINLGDLTRKYESLKKKVDNHGLVNLLAPEEYKKLQEKHDFLEKQTQDLEDALDSLKKAINKLDKESITRFKEAFESINDKFAEVVGKMFQGGEGKLVMTEPDHLLETGIDLVVKPGGKRFQSMNLLSGGEKTISAIALIISACLIRPVPFLLLDEIDAPLDESNTARFLKLIKDIAKNSQIVLVTHNKSTMVEVDKLIGITANKSAVSKVVSAELKAI